jgi:hypothetical protein
VSSMHSFVLVTPSVHASVSESLLEAMRSGVGSIVVTTVPWGRLRISVLTNETPTDKQSNATAGELGELWTTESASLDASD